MRLNNRAMQGNPATGSRAPWSRRCAKIGLTEVRGVFIMSPYYTLISRNFAAECSECDCHLASKIDLFEQHMMDRVGARVRASKCPHKRAANLRGERRRIAQSMPPKKWSRAWHGKQTEFSRPSNPCCEGAPSLRSQESEDKSYESAARVVAALFD
jgi:hypothetical protein